MDRLTENNKHYYGEWSKIRKMCYMGFDNSCTYPTCSGCQIIRMYRTLSAYEDTNLTPEEIAALQAENARLRERLEAAVGELSTYKECRLCIHVQDQQYCYKNCQRHVDVDNFRTYPCWQWRGLTKEGQE